MLLPLLLFAASSSSAQMVDIGQCAGVEDRLERFACYESLAEEAREGEDDAGPAVDEDLVRPPRPDESARTAAQPAREAPRAEQEFGLQPSPEEAEKEAEAEREEMHSQVASVREIKPNHWRITLENGQVWQQMVGKRYNLRPGQEVRIYPSSWGKSYRLTAAAVKGFIQVERLQ